MRNPIPQFIFVLLLNIIPTYILLVGIDVYDHSKHTCPFLVPLLYKSLANGSALGLDTMH